MDVGQIVGTSSPAVLVWRVLVVVALWFAVAVPVAVVLGRLLHRTGTAFRPVLVTEHPAVPSPPLAAGSVLRWRFGLLMATAFVLLLSLGTAASASVPGSPLWPLKLGSERLELLLTRDPARRVGLHVAFAYRRIGELDRVHAVDANPVGESTIVDLLGSHLENAAGDVRTLDSPLDLPRELRAGITDLLARQSEVTDHGCAARGSAACDLLRRAVAATDPTSPGTDAPTTGSVGVQVPTPASEPTPAVEEAPVPVAGPTPAVEEAPEPVAEPTPAVEEAPEPVAEPSPAAEEIPPPSVEPVPSDPPVGGDTPIIEGGGDSLPEGDANVTPTEPTEPTEPSGLTEPARPNEPAYPDVAGSGLPADHRDGPVTPAPSATGGAQE